MARPISSEDAKKAIEKHQSLLAKLSAIEASIEILRSEIKKYPMLWWSRRYCGF